MQIQFYERCFSDDLMPMLRDVEKIVIYPDDKEISLSDFYLESDKTYKVFYTKHDNSKAVFLFKANDVCFIKI
ncbi:hypothetical protein EP56_15160 [Listeriaceae bacterium FSL A5-0209]|nr:hypothetical protein EP56_15160 [Listeriaceae bacterium FSL A5-0209]